MMSEVNYMEKCLSAYLRAFFREYSSPTLEALRDAVRDCKLFVCFVAHLALRHEDGTPFGMGLGG